MTFVQSLLVIMCVLTCLVEGFLFLAIVCLPAGSRDIGLAVRWFIYGLIPTTLLSAYLLHLATTVGSSI